MNHRMVWRTLARTLLIEAALMVLPLCIALYYGEAWRGFVYTILLIIAAFFLLQGFKPRSSDIYAKEGFLIVALSWIILSAFGALPFVIDGAIPSYIDAFFETVSGFTTTGATILTDIEAVGYGLLFWRSFTHWIGGMGVLVFMLAVLPLAEERSMHIMRAEVPGPVVGKLVPRMRNSAMILYVIYLVLTLVEIVLLLFGGMSLFDAAVHAFGTAGTGGFSSRNISVAYYNSAYIDMVIGTFMILFGINFNLYFFLLLRRYRDVGKNEELRWYLGIIVFSVVTIALCILPQYSSFPHALRYAYFQVASIITTTGYSTANFDLWPEYARSLLVFIMFIGACAGSTGGGIKVSRIIIIIKSSVNEIKRMLNPRSVNLVKVDGNTVDGGTIHGTLIFVLLYFIILLLSILVISLDDLDFTTSVTGVIACFSNIGPGLSLVGPMGNFSMFSPFSKIVLSMVMLLGRLEIFPILTLFSPATWRRN
ncbi:MAG: TrkH family potassium uptake protein [Clostridia bacterium]|nr:TrkH family potassium uptake protein [Clostridia bacterium]